MAVDALNYSVPLPDRFQVDSWFALMGAHNCSCVIFMGFVHLMYSVAYSQLCKLVNCVVMCFFFWCTLTCLCFAVCYFMCVLAVTRLAGYLSVPLQKYNLSSVKVLFD